MKPSVTNPQALANARSYIEQHREQYGLPEFDPNPSQLKLSPELGARVGRLYERLPHAPNHPKVRAAYEQLKREILAQYLHLKHLGVQMEPWTQPGQPYKNSREMREDVKTNGHLWYFPTFNEHEKSFGEADAPEPKDNPLLERTGEWMNGYNQSYNDLFRAVHDYFGHAVHGHQFGPQGEIRAWAEHAKMFSPAARPALTMETHGQNSWVNFGPHGPQKLPPPERPYAKQKTNVIPKRLYPHQLARRAAHRQDSPAAALSGSYTVNAQKKREIAEQILAQAKLRPSAVRTVLAHEKGKGVRTAVIAAIQKRLDPGLAKYVASWLGLLGREKALTAFVPHVAGHDRLHILHSPTLPVNEMGEYLSQAGVPKFSVEEQGNGSRAFVFSPSGSLDPHVSRVAGGLDARVTTYPGTGFKLGSGEGSDADARAHYRNTISDFERSTAPASTGPTS